MAFAVPRLRNLTDDELAELYSAPETGKVFKKNGETLDEHYPPYVVAPTRLDSVPVHDTWREGQLCAKLIDFGQAFPEDRPPAKVNMQLGMKAPELVFGGVIDRRIDLWSAGCMVSIVTLQELAQHLQLKL